jgi:2-desacetyl-2-hydroxyethyl bacteriochlorophyllide A dehydrogenase
MAQAEQITFTAIGQVAVTQADPPGEPGPGQLLVATSHVGICGSDLAVLGGHHPWTKPPVVTGHEITGRVAATGPGVRRLRPGEQVVLNPLRGCGSCARCRQGAVNQCESGAVRGYRLPGAAVTQLLVDQAELLPVPAGVPAAQACLAEPLAAAWHAATRADELDDVAVIGAGSIGQLVLSCLRHLGAGRITVIEPEPGKRALARGRGADEVAAPGGRPARPRFTAVYDCVSQPGTVDWATQAAMAGGSVVTVGVPAGPVPLPLPRTQRFEVALLGSGLYTPGELATAIELIGSGRVDVGPLISDTFPLSQAVQAYARAAEPASVKVVVAMP